MVSKRHTYSLGDRDLDDDDLPGTLDGIRPFPSDDEVLPKWIIFQSSQQQLFDVCDISPACLTFKLVAAGESSSAKVDYP